MMSWEEFKLYFVCHRQENRGNSFASFSFMGIIMSVYLKMNTRVLFPWCGGIMSG